MQDLRAKCKGAIASSATQAVDFSNIWIESEGLDEDKINSAKAMIQRPMDTGLRLEWLLL